MALEQIGIIGWRVLKAANDNRKSAGEATKELPRAAPAVRGANPTGDLDATWEDTASK